MNPAIIAAGGLGALFVLDNQQVQRAIGAVTGGVATSAERAAMHELQRKSPIAGAAFTLAPIVSPLNAFATVRAALVTKYGAQANQNQMPARITLGGLRELAAAWLSACEAGVSDTSGGALDALHNLQDWNTDDIAAAVASLREWTTTGLDFLEEADDIDEVKTRETVKRVIALASAMEGAGFALPGTLPSEQQPSAFWGTLGEINADRVLAAPGVFVGAIADGATSLLGDVVGPIVGGILKEPIVWVAAFGFVAYKVTR